MVLSSLNYSPVRAGDLRARVRLRFGSDAFQAEIDRGRLRVARCGLEPASAALSGDAMWPADAVLSADAATLRAVVFGGRPVASAVRAGDLEIEGDRRLAARFAGCFPRPTPAPAVPA